jgi:hypothetical protein
VAKTYTNFRKADWPAFIRESEGVFRGLQLSTSVGAGEKIFCKILLTAAKHAIPAGFHKDCKPGILHEANILINERDTLQAADPTDPAIEILNHNITKIISENKKSIWWGKVAASGSRLDSSKCWSLLCGLSGKRTYEPLNQPVTFGKTTFSNPYDISKKFIRQYVPHPKSDPLTRKVQQQLHRAHPIDHTFTLFTLALTEEAIRRSTSSTATGPDGLTSLHLKNLGPAGIRYLTELFNISVKDAVVPAIWKSAIVLTILKPGKPADQGTSYHPISLLCPAIKILERLLLPMIYIYIFVAFIKHFIPK